MDNLKCAVLINCVEFENLRLYPIETLLKGKQYNVTLLLSDFSHTKKQYITERKENYTYIHVPAYQKNVSLKRIWSHLWFGKAVKKYLDELHPDLIYLMIPPNNMAKYCLAYKKAFPKTKYILDILDLWPESMPMEVFKSTYPFRKWAKLRNDSILSADAVITECNLYQKKLAPYLEKNDCVETLYLFKEQSEDERSLVLEQLKTETQADKVVLGYLGSINHIIDIKSLDEIIRSLVQAGKKVEFRIIGDGEGRDTLIEAAKKAGAQVQYYGKIFEESRKIEILGPCDFALNLMKSSVVVGLTTKSMDYFSYGLPLINNIRGDTWNLVEEQNLGINYTGDQEALCRQVSAWLMSDRIGGRRRVLVCFDESFTRAAFERKLMNVLEKIENIE